MTIQERKKAIEELRAANEAMRSAAKKEERGLTADELVKISNNVSEITRHNEEIAVSEAELRAKRPAAPASKPSLSKMIVEARDRADKTIYFGESRSIVGGVDQPTAGVAVYDIVPAIRENLVLAKAGARVLTGLKDDLKLPVVSSEAFVGDETEDMSTKGSGGAYAVTLTPKRICCFVDISNKVLSQSNQSVDAVIEQDIVTSIAHAIQNNIFCADNAIKPGLDWPTFAAGTDPQPSLSADDLFDMEANALSYDASQWSFICDPKAISAAKKLEMAGNGAGLIVSDNKLLGYPTYTCTTYGANEQSYGVAFANWSELFIGFFDDIEVQVDPYTQATKGMTRLIVNAYVDVKFRQHWQKAYSLGVARN